MKSRDVLVMGEEGLRSRNASSLVKKAMSFKSSIVINFNDKHADAKSILNVLALRINKGSKLIVKAEGSDEVLAISEIVKFIENIQ